MLDEIYRELLTLMAESANMVLPDLDAPVSDQGKKYIHSLIRTHDEIITMTYLRPLMEKRESRLPQNQLEELNRMRGYLVDLEVKVFVHLNDLDER